MEQECRPSHDYASIHLLSARGAPKTVYAL